jgi:hypothetical protein
MQFILDRMNKIGDCETGKYWEKAKTPKKPPFERGCRPQAAGVCRKFTPTKTTNPRPNGHPLSKGGKGAEKNGTVGVIISIT